VAMLVVGVSSLFGLDLSDEQAQIGSAMQAVGVAVAQVAAAVAVIVGRVRATKKIAKPGKLHVLLTL